MCCPLCATYPTCRSRTVIHVHKKVESRLHNPHFHFCHEYDDPCDFRCRSCGRLIVELPRLPVGHFQYGCCHRCAEYARCDFLARHHATVDRDVRAAAGHVEIPGPSTADVSSGPLHCSPHSARVLVVDEDARLLSMIEEKLRASPQLFTVRTAGNGHIALRVLREFQPHVMLLDPGMPKPGGVALCREAGPAAHGRGARIIALVRPSDQELIAVAREYGIDVCLSRAAALDTIKYEVWRLAQEATKEAYAGQGR